MFLVFLPLLIGRKYCRIALESHVKISFLKVFLKGNYVMLNVWLKIQITEVKLLILSNCLYCII